MLKAVKVRRGRRWTSPTKQKILALLAAGTSIGLTRLHKKQHKIFRNIPKELKVIDKRYLVKILDEFYNHRLIDYHENNDGTIEIVLTKEGELKSLKMNFDKLEIKPPKTWDKVWRIVSFDVPEKKRAVRDAIRSKLRELGFYELHKSIFVFPYPCRDQTDFLIEILDARPFVLYIETSIIEPNARLKLHFGLN